MLFIVKCFWAFRRKDRAVGLSGRGNSPQSLTQVRQQVAENQDARTSAGVFAWLSTRFVDHGYDFGFEVRCRRQGEGGTQRNGKDIIANSK